MKKIVFSIISLIFTASLFAQTNSNLYEVPDYNGIKEVISDSNTEFYYPKLMEMMKQHDPTLTIAEYRFLYYGYMFQPEYNIYFRSSKESELTKYYQSRRIPKKNYDNIIEIINQILEEDPFYIRGLNFLAYILHLKGDEEEAAKIALQFRGIIDVILSSGDGQSPETGYHVISTAHEYVVMNSLQLLNGIRETRWINHNACDCFKLNRANQICFVVPYSVIDEDNKKGFLK